MMKIFINLIFTGFIIINPLFAQDIVLNEIMASNGMTISDEDGDYPDWIEIYNPGPNSINLEGYGLSDDPLDIRRWIFPGVTLSANQFLLIYASGKNRTQWINHWETIIDWGDLWRYRIGTSAPPSDWHLPQFDDSSWQEGPSGIGYGDEDDATQIDPVISLYMRRGFNVVDVANVVTAHLHVDYDDAFVAYLNGVEIARKNIGEVNSPPQYFETAYNPHEAMIYQGGFPEAFSLSGINSILHEGLNVLAIQVHNFNATSSDMTIIPFLTLGLIIPPDEPRGINDLLKLTLPNLHTNFRINSSGETITLSNSLNQTVDQFTTDSMTNDISQGRQPDGGDSWLYFEQATPGSSNTTPGYLGIADEPLFSISSGFYSGSQQLVLTKSSQNADLRYTVDGSVPTATSLEYTAPILISETSVVRAIIFETNKLPSRVVTNTFFIAETFQLPVISISTDPANLWDEETGIYVMGPGAEPDFPHYGANFWQDWEIPVHFEFFEENKTSAFNLDCGVKIYGGWMRGLPQKSLAIFARPRYGYNEINYQIFPDLELETFQSIVLRNSGNDWDYTMMRDALLTRLISGLGIDLQAYRPAVVFLNGFYWGIQNVREKISEHFLASHHDVDANSIDLLEYNGNVIQGSSEHYELLINFLNSHDITDPDNYNYVASLMDIDNFIDYQVAQIYFDNTDWPGNNIKYWRSNLLDGKWRWIVYDVDFGFGLYDPQAYANNTLQFATEPNGPEWPNPPWSTFMLRTLLENQEFKKEFINRFADRINMQFDPNLVIDRINELSSAIASEMDNHFQRWGGSLSAWEDNLFELKQFAIQRPDYARSHLRIKFGLSGQARIDMRISPEQGGRVKINSLTPDKYPWRGIYFTGVSIPIKAIANPGYKFVGWAGLDITNEPKIELNLNKDTMITALFEIDNSNSSSIVINEINYNSAPNFDPEDWIELYNNSDNEMDISGWIFKDSDDLHSFILPENTIVATDSFLVLCRDSSAFTSLFPDVVQIAGNFTFALNNAGELLRLFDGEGDLVDSLTYDDQAPWPVEPDGSGPTLALKNPDLDNAEAQNWAASAYHGTPGEINDVYVAIESESYPVTTPSEYALYQNYPNPFNPITYIPFQLPRSSEIRLDIFDVLGKRIATLQEGHMPAGYHMIKWQVSENVSSGIYFYRIEFKGTGSMVRKMILLR